MRGQRSRAVPVIRRGLGQKACCCGPSYPALRRVTPVGYPRGANPSLQGPSHPESDGTRPRHRRLYGNVARSPLETTSAGERHFPRRGGSSAPMRGQVRWYWTRPWCAPEGEGNHLSANPSGRQARRLATKDQQSQQTRTGGSYRLVPGLTSFRIVEAVVSLAHRLGMRSIAEGVEPTEPHKSLSPRLRLREGYMSSPLCQPRA